MDVPEIYRSKIAQAARVHPVPAMMLAALLFRESSFDPNCRTVEPDGTISRGMAQINDKAHPDVTDAQAYDPDFAINWAAAELRALRDGGCRNWYETLLAYNGGMTAVYAYRDGKPFNAQYATDIFILSQLNQIADKCQRVDTLCGELWALDQLNEDLYHEVANWMRLVMGWPVEAPPSPPLPPAPANVMPKFGRKPYVKDERDLRYSKYRAAAMPTYPASFGHQGLIPWNAWGMLGNDTVGDCTCAAADHETMLWTTEGGNAATFVPANTLSDYSAITGYNPDDPDSDQGAVIRDVLAYRQKTGMLDAAGRRHKIGAYLALDPAKLDEVLEAAYLFSAVEIGINIPQSAMAQFENDLPWDVTADDGPIIGSHDVPVVGWNGALYCITWGGIQEMTPAFFAKYCEEAWVILSPEMLNAQGLSPEGFDLAQLQADLAAVTDYTPPAPTPPAPGQTVITVTAGKKCYTVDGQEVLVDTPAFLMDPPGHLFVPIRTVEAILEKELPGVTGTVAWDEGDETATLTFVPN